MTVIDFEPPPVTDDSPTVVATRRPDPVTAAPTAPTTVTAATTAPTTTAPTTAAPMAAEPMAVERRRALQQQPERDGRRLLADLAEPLSRSWGLALVVAWVVVIAVGLAVEPAPFEPDAPVPLAADLLSMGLLTAWGAMAAGVIQGRRFAGAASLVGGLGLLALTLGCPLSGHHAGIGAWWGVQIVGAVGLVALSRRALRSS
jgi:hypothetical protein